MNTEEHDQPLINPKPSSPAAPTLEEIAAVETEQLFKDSRGWPLDEIIVRKGAFKQIILAAIKAGVAQREEG